MFYHVAVFPPVWEVEIPISGMRLPPQRRIHCDTPTQDTAYRVSIWVASARNTLEMCIVVEHLPTSHHVNVLTSNASRISPDLIEKTWDVEAGQICALQPCGLHGATPSSSGWRALLDEKH